ncbi:hypothetical protein OL599_04575 [Rhodovastum sp. RN2-1]|uniref:Uncharacterized protein n=1 Tax=Limobrevibacterium gyesilva TaxID=2991712 RepID=A0AA41YIR0_9PROT|nr:hypothetical protein [Limobrevibacterium gyesilva]
MQTQHIAALRSLTGTLVGTWDCEIDTCDEGIHCAYLVARDWADGNAAAFVVSWKEGQFILADRRQTSDFGNTGAAAAPIRYYWNTITDVVGHIADTIGVRAPR